MGGRLEARGLAFKASSGMSLSDARKEPTPINKLLYNVFGRYGWRLFLYHANDAMRPDHIPPNSAFLCPRPSPQNI